jgi:hypothetical protein
MASSYGEDVAKQTLAHAQETERLALQADMAEREARAATRTSEYEKTLIDCSAVVAATTSGPLTMSGNSGPKIGATGMPHAVVDGPLSRIAALEVAEAHVQQLEKQTNERGYPKHQMSAAQRIVYVLAYADWLCGGEPPTKL